MVRPPCEALLGCAEGPALTASRANAPTLQVDRLAALKEHEQVGHAVEVDVRHGTHRLARGGVEFLDQIDSIVEIPVGLAPDEGTAFVVLMNIRSAVEVGIDSHAGELALTIVTRQTSGRPSRFLSSVRTSLPDGHHDMAATRTTAHRLITSGREDHRFIGRFR